MEPPSGITVLCCRTWLSWSVAVQDGPDFFVVESAGPPDEEGRFSYRCSCGESGCRHALYAAGEHCGWAAGPGQEETRDPGSCPRCGSPTDMAPYVPG